jgi:flavin reductase
MVVDGAETGLDAGVPGSAASLRRAVAEFTAGVTVVSTVWQGVQHAMTATAFCSVSLEPPLVLVSVGHVSRFHRAILGAGYWAVSFLAADQERIARHFATSGRDLLSQFDNVAHRDGPATGAPVIIGALSWLECRTVSRLEAGDHTIVIGEVLWTATEPSDGPPLTYYRGTYFPGQPSR